MTPIGFGAFKIGRNEGIKYEAGYALPDERQVEHLLNGVLDTGVNYIDTAPAYGLSEERIGRAIAHRRREFVISTKVGETFAGGRSTYDFSPDAVRESVERSLKRLRTEALDIVFVHAHSDDVRLLTETDVAATLAAMRDEGSIRAIGFSGKTVDGAARALEWADVVMIEYHLNDRSHEAVIAQCAQRGIGVVVKKGLASGQLPADDAIGFVLGNKSVSSLTVGTLSLDHLRENIRSADAVDAGGSTGLPPAADSAQA